MNAEILRSSSELMQELARQMEINKGQSKEIERLQLFFNEMEATNNHLIAATWREREMKRQLKETLDELSKTKQIVESQNMRISESISYARKIQLAINATETNLKEEFPESFIYYKPKDVISGDFPWYYKTGNSVFFAAVDCTGHGVPGAMLSIIGNLLLNDIIANHPGKKTSEVLDSLHNQVVQTLKQNSPGNLSSDGMDIALCKVDLDEKKIYFSGAHRPLLFVKKDGTSVILKGDRFPIGGMQYKGQNQYSEQVLPYEEGDMVYIFSDGYPDQVGGVENRKFSTNRLNELLASPGSADMDHVEMNIDRTFSHWKGVNRQVDDVLIIGVKF
ncbi:MAG: SpoIIE family protein phosphatase [Bacteroidia bacterium]